ncbi:poly(A)-binding protein-interacting protein [Encephalitozoon intestinalis ATCC 50506]|uniref:Poly(A)-binding protein-interacting protein n=1 Tax=Encephalitozoon intestinalis (strain ATCC 50506) TaxID=876142 RepID=E0SAG4_ENCIT|nr:poly(A)-binding protein-interacting protein [Encephalitozoon intestinalis ATCC 50506]ADM12589.1 poly(A)-binding protein-interacting protein [Encephalitozoon intestinalis ATCC 50506]UTX46446.1 LsmAD domain-containing protein [Encephalitozoon intestinalis]
MDNYTIAICFKNNPSRMIGTFLSNEDGMVKLENAFFEMNPGIVFPTISISESDIITVKKTNEGVREKSEDKSIPLETTEKASKGKETSSWDSFKTDSQISRAVEVTAPPPTPPNESATLERFSEEGSKDWNQFEANSKLFNIDNKFDESEYMEVLDKNSESYKRKLSMAKKIEKEIMLSTTTDPHRLEERGLGMSEENEDAYSSVVGKEHKKDSGKCSAKGHEEESFDDEKSKQSEDEGTRRKMVIEIEGLSTPKIKEECASKGESNKNEESSNSQEEKKDSKPKKSVRYGWMHTKFDSSKNLLRMIKSKFKGILDTNGGEAKWGTGPNWEVAGRNIIKKTQKGGRTPPTARRTVKKSPVSK